MQVKNSIAGAVKITGIIIVIVGVIFGIIAGTHFQMLDTSGFRPEYVFNWPLMVGVWFASVVAGMGFIGFSEIILLLQEIANRSYLVTDTMDKIKAIHENAAPTE